MSQSQLLLHWASRPTRRAIIPIRRIDLDGAKQPQVANLPVAVHPQALVLSRLGDRRAGGGQKPGEHLTTYLEQQESKQRIQRFDSRHPVELLIQDGLSQQVAGLSHHFGV